MCPAPGWVPNPTARPGRATACWRIDTLTRNPVTQCVPTNALPSPVTHGGSQRGASAILSKGGHQRREARSAHDAESVQSGPPLRFPTFSEGWRNSISAVSYAAVPGAEPGPSIPTRAASRCWPPCPCDAATQPRPSASAFRYQPGQRVQAASDPARFRAAGLGFLASMRPPDCGRNLQGAFTGRRPGGPERFERTRVTEGRLK
jgi:hypothetical protein